MITTIGAGPAGSFYASKEKNDDVVIFEEDNQIGKPVSCTGIVTNSIYDLIKIPNNIIVNKIKAYSIISPNKNEITIRMKKPDVLLNRSAFDEYLCEKAIDNGAKLHLNERFLRYDKIGKSKYKIKTTKKTYVTDMIVGADGPKSNVAISAKMFDNRLFVRGLQARCKYKDLEPGIVKVRLDQGEFSWIVPEDDNIARVGVIGADLEKIKNIYRSLIGKRKIIENQSGMIPIYNSKQELKKNNENIFLIGDAATHVKATTYGGIIYGMIDGQFLAQDKEKYEKNVRKAINKDLMLSLMIRKMMNKMTDKQVNELINIFLKKKNADLLGEFDRNYPSKFLIKLALQEPKLISLGLRILI
jgi:digeranylgeranylglycerophospholipid reductase